MGRSSRKAPDVDMEAIGKQVTREEESLFVRKHGHRTVDPAEWCEQLLQGVSRKALARVVQNIKQMDSAGVKRRAEQREVERLLTRTIHGLSKDAKKSSG